MSNIVVIGAGPAGLMAAEILSGRGAHVTVYDQMPSPARKFLMAGRGGLNLTHAEPLERFVSRYGEASERLRPILQCFPPDWLRRWADELGAETFVGSSGRIFPKAMKASPLLRAWLARLTSRGVILLTRHTWRGWRDGRLVFSTAGAPVYVRPDATLLALGGASWPRLGSTGDWPPLLRSANVKVVTFQPSNMGFRVAWSATFQERFSGHPLKNITISFGARSVRGEAMVTADGIEGGAIYMLSADLREAIVAHGIAHIEIDLRPLLSQEDLNRRLQRPRGKASLANFLRKSLNLSPLEINLLRETGGSVKSVPLILGGIQPLARALSTAGGVPFSAVDGTLELCAVPDVWVAGEMLDWEAPTGGYLLQACFSSGAFAAQAILNKIGA